jgi:hypothetical protein
MQMWTPVPDLEIIPERRNNHPSSHHTEALRGGGYFVCPLNAQDLSLDAIAGGLRLLVFHYLAIGR